MELVAARVSFRVSFWSRSHRGFVALESGFAPVSQLVGDGAIDHSALSFATFVVVKWPRGARVWERGQSGGREWKGSGDLAFASSPCGCSARGRAYGTRRWRGRSIIP